MNKELKSKPVDPIGKPGEKKDDFLESLESEAALTTTEETETGVATNSMFAAMRNAKPSDLKTLNSNYLKPESGFMEVYAYTGNTTFKGDNGIVPAVLLEDEQGVQWILATAMVVTSLSAVTELPAMVRLTYRGKKMNAKKQYYDDYNIEVLPKAVAQ